MSYDERPAQRPDGIDALEIEDLPPGQRAIARVLLRRGELAEAQLRQDALELAAELDGPGFAEALDALRGRQIVLQGAEPLALRLNLRRKSGRRLSSSIWDALE